MKTNCMQKVKLGGCFWLVLSVALGLPGCSSTPKSWQEIEQANQEKQAEKAGLVASELPSWYLNKTEDNDEYIYVVASASARNLHLAEDKLAVRLHAAVAKKLDVKTDLSTTEVSTVLEGAMQEENSALQTTSRTIAFGQTTAYESVEKKVVFEKGQFVLFEMARFPIGKWRIQQQNMATSEPSLNTPQGFEQAVEKMDQLKAKQ